MDPLFTKEDRQFCPKWCKYYHRDCNKRCEALPLEKEETRVKPKPTCAN